MSRNLKKLLIILLIIAVSCITIGIFLQISTKDQYKSAAIIYSEFYEMELEEDLNPLYYEDDMEVIRLGSVIDDQGEEFPHTYMIMGEYDDSSFDEPRLYVALIGTKSIKDIYNNNFYCLEYLNVDTGVYYANTEEMDIIAQILNGYVKYFEEDGLDEYNNNI